MGKRIFSTITLWALVFACLYFFGATGGIWLITLIAAFTLREFYALVRKMGHHPFDYGIIFGAMITLAPLYLEPLGIGALEIAALTVVAFAVRILHDRPAEIRVESLAWSVFGVIYIPFLLHFLVRIILIAGPHAATGLALCLWLIAVSKFCDVGALLSGMAFGKHKMAPVISPKKTWEGAIGGVLISAGLGAGIAHFAAQYYPATFTPLIAALAAVPIAILAIVSDLVESTIKRRASSKDSGNTIPGIGGVFDLSDSLILTAPVGYIVFHLL
ncbi:phosphatidate cytidylyltransferase [Nibricoccus aquaticus]|uniref:Phosphatidate cytidylyltransferase n=1 Tax=Nibricoccus aquaticus TaxID=2576891 RepID=A0A290QNG9_9BACT|nr:phosphatidate cytidylyltransferase [Nibricoccus aquaticus]ATC65892.1 phosphatidate cytidylyltransferase [Nibricoccus aquaticus]